MKSKALEVNLADYHVDVTVDDKYSPLQEIMSDYYGLLKRLDVFLKELSHPYKNWEFIVQESRSFSLNYFHLLKPHEKGPEAVRILTTVFIEAIELADSDKTKSDAVDNLMLFIQHVIKESDTELDRFLEVLDGAMARILDYETKIFYLFVRSFYQPDKIAGTLLEKADLKRHNFKITNQLLKRFYEVSFSHWLEQEDIAAWVIREGGENQYNTTIESLLDGVSHGQIESWRQTLETIVASADISSSEVTRQLIGLHGYMAIVDLFTSMPKTLFKSMDDKAVGRRFELLVLFYIIYTPGLSMVHERVLQEINRALTWLIVHEDYRNNLKLIDKTFTILEDLAHRFPPTVLNCVLKIGEAVYKTEEDELINYFIDHAFDLGFHSPMIKGIGDDWQVIGNTAHILNIRIWLELIGQKPKMSKRLLSALIIFLSVGGVFIKDTDLFPRDITKFLSTDISSVYNLVKQLARLLPVFFNEIGAEGQLRNISTQLDEECQRRDVLIHFLRKQSHVESSSRVVTFMEEVIHFWRTGDKKSLKHYVPPNIYQQIETKGPYIDGVGKIFSYLDEKGVFMPDDLLTIDEKALKQTISTITNVSGKDIKRAVLTISFYKLLNQKYKFDNIAFDSYLDQLGTESLPDIKTLRSALNETDIRRKLLKLFAYLDKLKVLILSSESFEARENMYHKRHIAVDIPSLYGSYHEAKFDALGLTLRIETIVNMLFEELINSIDLSLITKATFSQILEILMLFNRALKVDGITSNQMAVQFDLLFHSIEVREFSFTQYIDVFKGFSKAVKNVIDDNFHNIHGRNILQIISKIPLDTILPQYLPEEMIDDRKKLGFRVAELFFRERMVTSLGLQQLDVFINRILNTLFRQSEKLSEERLNTLFNYDPQNAMTEVGRSKQRIYHIIYLGNKGLNLIELKNLGWRVPPGFIVTTEAFNCRELIDNYGPVRDNFRKQVTKNLSALERITGKKYGNPGNPLLLSVRSGSSISQPGMLESYTNVGINQEIVESMAQKTGNLWFAWDNYRRFLQGYGMSFDLDRDQFDLIMRTFKTRMGVPLKKEFTGEQMKQLALAYKELIMDSGIRIVETPMDQLYLAINKVFSSWESPRAKAYRMIMGISNEWGTAVTVQSMVFGNVSRQSGSGVFFTHSPRLPGDTLRLWGDFTIGNQGEDVVSGLVRTLAISEMQREIEKRPTNISLESGFPELYDSLKTIAQKLIFDQGWDPQEMEFTFEGPKEKDLYLLQTRDMSVRERKAIRFFDVDQLKSSVSYLGRGIGVSGGPMSGRIVFSLAEIQEWRKKEPDTELIIIRGDTVSDDIREIYSADGILTARGGVTSHAAIVAYSLRKTCVVGCENLICNEEESQCVFGTVTMRSGDYISIDGTEGLIYNGYLKVNEL